MRPLFKHCMIPKPWSRNGQVIRSRLVFCSSLDKTALITFVPQSHFVRVPSPWIQHALVAAGVGTGIPASQAPIEVAPISPHQPSTDRLHVFPLKDDLESPDNKHRHRSSSVSGLEESPLVSADTFFPNSITEWRVGNPALPYLVSCAAIRSCSAVARSSLWGGTLK
jgi:hypothetical protein